MKFLLNSLIHTLPTQNNLKLWNKTLSDKCHSCSNRDSTLHCLSGCSVSLKQGRYTWRHDNILRYICESLNSDRYSVYSDLEGFSAGNGGTIPVSLTVTNMKPDLVIIDDHKKTVYIFELTVPFESNIKSRNHYKTEKYAFLIQDIKSHQVSVTAFEVGVRGFLTSDNMISLKTINSFCKKNTKFKTFADNISAISINSSYYIYTHRKEPAWVSPGPLGPAFT